MVKAKVSKTKKKKLKIQDKNMFTYLYNLRIFNSELLNINTIDDIEIFLSKLMAYIYDNTTLLTLFQDELKSVADADFEEDCEQQAEKVKNIVKKIAEKQNNHIDFYDKGRAEYTTKNKLIRFQPIDIPLIYLFLSIGLPHYDFSQNKPAKVFEMSNDLNSMYFKFSQKYSINVCENIEFYVVGFFAHNRIPNIYKKAYFKDNIIGYFKTCLNYVINTIQYKCSYFISEEYYDKKGFKIFNKINQYQDQNTSRKKEYYLTYKNNIFNLDKKIFNISDTHKETLKEILNLNNTSAFAYKKLPEYEKSKINEQVCRINKEAKALIAQKIIEFSKKENTYKLLQNIKFRDIEQ